MKYIKRFESNDLEELYNDIFNTTIKEAFLEFEDNGWEWGVLTRGAQTFDQDPVTTFSHLKIPEFKYIMVPSIDLDLHQRLYKVLKRCTINISGTIHLNGDIDWKTLMFVIDPEIEVLLKEEFNDFIVAIKRIASDIGRFQFSYDNIYGHRRILIEGKI